MQAFKTIILAASLAALVGCANQSPICTQTHGWQPWPDPRCNPPEASGGDLKAELAAAQQENQSLGLRLAGVKAMLADSQKDLATCRATTK